MEPNFPWDGTFRPDIHDKTWFRAKDLRTNIVGLGVYLTKELAQTYAEKKYNG